MTLGEKIQLCRKKKGMSQEDLANLLNVSRQAVQKWESNASKPEVNKLVEISNVLDVSVDYLLKEAQIDVQDNNLESNHYSDSYIDSNTIQTTKRLDPKRIKTIKVWMIIGCVLTPMFAGGSYLNNEYKPEALLFLLLYAVTIPLCVAAISKCKKAKSQNELVALGIVCALFVSFIGGILMVSSGEKYFIADRPKTREELEEDERNRILAEENAKKEREEREKQIAIQRENERIASLRSTKNNEIHSLFCSFKAKKYNPADIEKAEIEKNAAIKKINYLKEDCLMSQCVIEYKDFLNSFSLDEEFYIKRKKKIKKFFAIFTPCVCIVAALAILTSTVFVPLGKYNYAMSLIAQGKYDEANEYLYGNSWSDSSTQITVNKARKCFDSGDYESGIDILYKLGAEVNVSYELNGGEGKTSDTIKRTRYINNNPTRTGYTFNKWILDSYYIGDANSNYKTDLKLLASWNVRQYSITYHLNGGNCTNPNSYNIETQTFNLNNPTKTGYTFSGWTGTNLDSPSLNVTINQGSYGELVFYANWNANSYTIHLDFDGGDCISNSLSVTYNENYELPLPTKIGYTFLGWYEGETKWDSGIWQRTSDLYLKAKWEILVFNLIFELNGGVSAELPSTYTYFDNDIIIPNPSRTGYDFAGWIGTDLTEPTKNLIIPTHSLGDKCFEAQWEGLTYIIEFDTDGGVMDTDSMTAVFGENCTLPIPTKTGYTFMGWDYNNTIISNGIWNIPDNVTLTAQWSVTTYNLSFNLDGGSISVIPPATYTYFSETITIADPTRGGYTFSGWKNIETNEVTLTSLTIPSGSLGDKSFIALWNGLSYHVSFDPNGGECSVTETTVVFGSNVKLPVPTRSGYDFNGWWINGVSILYDGVWDIQHDVSLIAKWNATPVSSTYPSVSWGYYPQNVEENPSILSDLANATDIDGDGYIEYSGNKYAQCYCYTNAGRKSDSGTTTFTAGTLYYFRVSSIAWLGKPNQSSAPTSAPLHTRKVLDRSSFGSTNNYSSSSIKTYLEGTFYNKIFTSYEKQRATNIRLPSTPSDCYDYASGSGYPTDYAVCRGITLDSSTKKTVYWVTQTNGSDVCMGVSGEYSSGYSTSPTTSTIGVRPIITFKF